LAAKSLPKPDGFIITEKGKIDLLCSKTCLCTPRLVGLLIECPDCGTVYGSLRDSLNWGTGRGDRKL
jgi:hypothetical protein